MIFLFSVVEIQLIIGSSAIEWASQYWILNYPTRRNPPLSFQYHPRYPGRHKSCLSWKQYFFLRWWAWPEKENERGIAFEVCAVENEKMFSRGSELQLRSRIWCWNFLHRHFGDQIDQNLRLHKLYLKLVFAQGEMSQAAWYMNLSGGYKPTSQKRARTWGEYVPQVWFSKIPDQRRDGSSERQY